MNLGVFGLEYCLGDSARNFLKINEKVEQIKVDELAQGVYFLKVGSVVKKLVINY